MERILFLDFDGPLWSDRVIKHHPRNVNFRDPTLLEIKQQMEAYGDSFGAATMTYWKMDETAVGMLNQIMDIQPFYTVVSSSWRDYCSRKTVELLFDKNDLNLQLHQHWMTPIVDHSSVGWGGSSFSNDQNRAREIKKWIKNHEDTVGTYAILDDPGSGGVLVDDRHVQALGLDPKNVVIVNYMIGMELEHFQHLKEILTA